MIWKWDFAMEILPDILQGLVVTLISVFWGMLIAMALGLVWAVCRRSHSKLLSWPVVGLVEFVRSTPLLVQIFFLFYVAPEFGLTLSPLLAGVLALGVHYSCYTSEVYRAGINAIPLGQWRAAKAINFTPRQTYQYVILPQAIPPIIPALGNYLIAMFKDAPLLSAITVLEVLRRAKSIGDETFRYLEPLTIVGVLFLVLSLISGVAVSWLQRKLKVERV